MVRVIREPSLSGATLGVLFVDGHFRAFTLEDEIRERAGEPVSAWKIPGQTAIPQGQYRMRLSWSPRFERLLPEVLAVPGFTGIRIHAGNRDRETAGCLLVGFQRAHAVIRESRPAVEALQEQIALAEQRDEPVWLRIENPVLT